MTLQHQHGVWMWLAASVLLGAVVGCDTAWRAYEQVALGRRLPEASVLVRKGRGDGCVRAWGNAAFLPIPVTGSGSNVCVVVDDQGRAVGKFYSGGIIGHWGLCQFVSQREVMEVQIPPNVFREPSREYQRPWPAGTSRTWQIEEWLEPLRREIPPEQMPQTISASEGPSSLSSLVKVDTVAMSVMAARLKPRVAEQIRAGRKHFPIDLRNDIDLTGLEAFPNIDMSGITTSLRVKPAGRIFVEISTRSPLPAPRDVRDYLLLVERLADGAPSQPEPFGVKFVVLPAMLLFQLAMCTHGYGLDLSALARIPDAFSGVTRDGYDWRFTTAQGAWCRVRNMGDRRIRIEFGLTRVFDPFMWLAAAHQYQSVDDTRIDDYTRKIQQNLNDATARLNRGILVERKGWHGDALLNYERAVDLDPTLAEAWFHLARERGRRGGVKDAIAGYSRAIELNPEEYRAYDNRGALYRRTGQYQKALADYARAIALCPDNPVPYNNRAIAYYYMARYGEAWVDVLWCRELGWEMGEDFLEALREGSVRKPRAVNSAGRGAITGDAGLD